MQVYHGVYVRDWGRASASGSSTDRNERGLLAVRYEGAREQTGRINAWQDEEFAPRLLALPRVLAARRY